MNIVGLDALVFGVDDVAGCAQFLTDYGLTPMGVSEAGGRFEALDGTAVVIARADDPGLPPAFDTGCMLRKTIMGVGDAQTLQAIAAELRKDREVRQLADGSIESVDDAGFTIGFQLSVRRPFEKAGERVNAPGAPAQRPVNALGVDLSVQAILPRSLSHVVYFVPDVAKAEAFYVERLGFHCTDRFAGGVYDLTRSRHFIGAIFVIEIAIDKLRVLPVGHEADLLRLLFLRRVEIRIACDIADLALQHVTEWKIRA